MLQNENSFKEYLLHIFVQETPVVGSFRPKLHGSSTLTGKTRTILKESKVY